jgi:hypothetical protein
MIDEEVKLRLNEIAEKYEGMVSELRQQLAQTKSMLIEAQERVAKLEQGSVRGTGRVGLGIPVGLSNKVDREEFERMLPHRIKAATLEEVVQFEAERAGVSVDQYIKAACERARLNRSA